MADHRFATEFARFDAKSELLHLHGWSGWLGGWEVSAGSGSSVAANAGRLGTLDATIDQVTNRLGLGDFRSPGGDDTGGSRVESFGGQADAIITGEAMRICIRKLRPGLVIILLAAPGLIQAQADSERARETREGGAPRAGDAAVL